MAHIDPLKKSAAIAALGRINNDSTITGNDVAQMSANFAIPLSTVRRWAAAVHEGTKVPSNSSVPNRDLLPTDALASIAHHRCLKAAHRELREKGRYSKSYAQFARDFHTHDPALQAGLLRGRDGMIAASPTMSYPRVGRNAIWVLDHTMSDVRVITESLNIGRPWVSIFKDKGSGVVMGIRVTKERPNSAGVIALLAQAMLGDTPTARDARFIGGRPESLLVDNGGENTGDALVNGLVMLGIGILPTTPGHSWQNGSAENIIGRYQQDCEAGQPGYVKGGKGADGGVRFTASTYDRTDIDTLINLESLRHRAATWAGEYNVRPGSDGLSPLQRWAADDFEVEHVSRDEIRWAMTTNDKLCAVTKNGVYFRKREYQAAELSPWIGKGKKLTLRYLDGVIDWVELWNERVFVARAELKSALSASQQAKIIARRKHNAKEVQKAEQASINRRNEDAHEQALSDAESDDASSGTESSGDTATPPTRRRKPRIDRKGELAGGAESHRQSQSMAKAADRAAEKFAPLQLGGTTDETQ